MHDLDISLSNRKILPTDWNLASVLCEKNWTDESVECWSDVQVLFVKFLLSVCWIFYGIVTRGKRASDLVFARIAVGRPHADNFITEFLTHIVAQQIIDKQFCRARTVRVSNLSNLSLESHTIESLISFRSRLKKIHIMYFRRRRRASDS